MKAPMDAYTLRARLQPALLTVAPLATVVIGLFPDGVTGWTALWSALVASGGAYLVAEFGRDAGKRKEDSLFAIWGGKPTTLCLSHRTASNQVVLVRYHKQLQELIPELALPDPDEERSDPVAASEAYEAASAYLRERTRDRDAYPLVYEALSEYGFRRNLWGLKPVGLTCSIFGFSVSATLLAVHFGLGVSISVSTMVIVTVLNAGFVLSWLVKVRPAWVRVTGFAYADRLLETIDSIGARAER